MIITRSRLLFYLFIMSCAI